MMKEVRRASVKKKKSSYQMSDEQKNSNIPYYCEVQGKMINTISDQNWTQKLSSEKDPNEYFIGVPIYWLLVFFSFLVFMILPLLVQTYLVPFLIESK